MIANMSDSDFNMFYYKKRLLDKANKSGLSTSSFILDEWDSEIKKIYQRLCKFLCLAHHYSTARLEKACERAYYYEKGNRETVRMILKQGLDILPLSPTTDVFGQLKLRFDD